MGTRRQPSSVGVSQPQAPRAHLPVQQTILFNEGLDHVIVVNATGLHRALTAYIAY